MKQMRLTMHWVGSSSGTISSNFKMYYFACISPTAAYSKGEKSKLFNNKLFLIVILFVSV